MRTWEVLFPLVLPQVIGCPEPTVETELRRAARAWCERTLCWRQSLDAVTTREGVMAYDLNLPSRSELVKAVDASIGGEEAPLEGAYATPIARRDGGERRILINSKREFYVLPVPGAGAQVVISACLMPSNTADGLPDIVADSYGEKIADGALARLMNMKAPWGVPALAATFKDDFERAINTEKVRVWRAYSSARPRTGTTFF